MYNDELPSVIVGIVFAYILSIFLTENAGIHDPLFEADACTQGKQYLFMNSLFWCLFLCFANWVDCSGDGKLNVNLLKLVAAQNSKT